MAGRIRMEVAILAMAIVTTLWATAVAQSSACTNVIISMSPCLDYITGNSSSPSSSCCSQLANVVKSQPQCLCEVLNGGASSLGVNVNQTQALALPGACKVQTPSTSRCNTGTPDSTSAGNGSKRAPSTDHNGTSDANSTEMTVSRLFILQLFITISYASTFVTI